MDRFSLNQLATPKDAADKVQQVSYFLNEGGQFNKKNANDFLDAIYMELTSSQTSPVSKTMTLHVLKQMTYQAQARFFSLLSTHKLLEFLFNQAKNVDPKKNLNEKGLKKFDKFPEVGKDYMRLLLQIVNFWGQKFAKGKNSEPTRYKKNLAQLKNLGVILPSNYEIFDPNQYKLRSKKNRQSVPASVPTPTGNEANIPSKIISGMMPKQGKLQSELQYTKQKIYIFLQELEQAEDADRLQNLIKTNHSFFEKQKLKYQGRQNEIDENIIADYSSIYYFLSEESKFYNEYVPVNDFSSYISQIKMSIQTTFENRKQGTSKDIKMEQKQPLMSNTLTQPQQSNPPRPNRMAENQIDSKALISNLYARLQQRSKSPNTGFKSVQMELQKQKQMAKKNPVRRSSKSPRHLGRSGEGGLNRSNASNLRQSKIHPIFTSPPNPRIDFKAYEGDAVLQNHDLMSSLYSLKKEQGSRRFKISNFREKNPLFENDQIQVGYKSQAVYQQINDFNHFILLNIFIGNKTEEGIKQFQVQYKADNNQLLYANPRNVDSIIPAGYQNKHDLMITPLAVPYNLMTMHIRYKFRDTGYMTSIVLPNSVLKFASYMKISRSDFDSNWRSAKKYKTNPFKLCKQLPPDSFNKWIPVLDNITRYSQFSREGSDTDLQMFCLVIMLQKHEAVLKINIRPNLDVVLQLGVLDTNQEGIEYFKFYLQTLELMLKQIDV